MPLVILKLVEDHMTHGSDSKEAGRNRVLTAHRDNQLKIQEVTVQYAEWERQGRKAPKPRRAVDIYELFTDDEHPSMVVVSTLSHTSPSRS